MVTGELKGALWLKIRKFEKFFENFFFRVITTLDLEYVFYFYINSLAESKNAVVLKFVFPLPW